MIYTPHPPLVPSPWQLLTHFLSLDITYKYSHLSCGLYDWLSLGNTFTHVTSLDGLLGVFDSFLGTQILAMTLAGPSPWL